jgi:hypothetical protein
MTDEEIDTSDIPPLDEEFFARAKWLLPRLHIDWLDFLQARRFAGYIIKQRLHDKKKTEPARARQQLVHLAFNTSLIISYSRPFHWNKNFRGQPDSSLRKEVSKVLQEPHEAELHAKVLSLRDSAYAHSAARSQLIEGLDYGNDFALTRSIEMLDRPTTEKLRIIIEKWISYLEAEKTYLKRLRARRA